MEHIENIKLIPAIELNSYDYSEKEFNPPEKLRNEVPEEWDKYSDELFKDSGLINLPRIQKGIDYFDVTKLNKKQLKIILKKIFSESFEDELTIENLLEDISNYSPFINGGYILCINERSFNFPGCCSDLQNINEWKNLFSQKEKSNHIWNGHDCINVSYKIKGNNITFNSEIESITLTKKEYFNLMRDTMESLKTFIENAGPILDDILNIKEGLKVLETMVFRDVNWYRFTYHGWIKLNCWEDEKTSEFIENVELINPEKSYHLLEGFNDHKSFNFSGSRNYFVEYPLQILKLAAKYFTESYGKLYIRDEDDIDNNNNYIVYVLTKGKIEKYIDEHLSPCIPKIEDEE